MLCFFTKVSLYQVRDTKYPLQDADIKRGTADAF